MKTRMFILSLLVVVLVAALPAFSQQQKIGYVNSAKIFQELPAAQDAQRRIDAMSKPCRTRSKRCRPSCRHAMKTTRSAKRSSMMPQKNRAAEADRNGTRMNEFRVRKLGNDGELALKRKSCSTRSRADQKRHRSGAKEERYSFVFDKTETIQILCTAIRHTTSRSK